MLKQKQKKKINVSSSLELKEVEDLTRNLYNFKDLDFKTWKKNYQMVHMLFYTH